MVPRNSFSFIAIIMYSSFQSPVVTAKGEAYRRRDIDALSYNRDSFVLVSHIVARLGNVDVSTANHLSWNRLLKAE